MENTVDLEIESDFYSLCKIAIVSFITSYVSIIDMRGFVFQGPSRGRDGGHWGRGRLYEYFNGEGGGRFKTFHYFGPPWAHLN